jgi:ferredoxin
MLSSIRVVYFSPTNTTYKILKAIISGIDIKNAVYSNLTSIKNRESFNRIIEEELVIIGIPVYEEHIPDFIASCLSTIIGRGQPVVLVSVYGNIGFGVSLKELYGISKECNLSPCAIGTFIGEHSFSNDEIFIAKDRPNVDDLTYAKEFGRRIKNKLSGSSISEIEDKIIPGSLPLFARFIPKNGAKRISNKPKININCTKCNACIFLCPMNAINYKLEIDNRKCIRCFSCVKKCSVKGRDIVYKKALIVKPILKKIGKTNKTNNYYI